MKTTARGAAWLLVSGVVAACSSFSATNPGEGDAGDDAGADHTVPVVTGTAPEAGVPNLLKDGTFESNCTALTLDHLSVTWVGDHTHNSSSGACRVCFLGDNAGSGEITLVGAFGTGPDRSLSATVFLLEDPSAPPLQADLSTNLTGSPEFGGGAVGPTTNLATTEWTQLVLTGPFESKDADGATLTIDVYSSGAVDGGGAVNAGASTGCFYVDDASLFFAN